jgi:hypothetical protein
MLDVLPIPDSLLIGVHGGGKLSEDFERWYAQASTDERLDADINHVFCAEALGVSGVPQEQIPGDVKDAVAMCITRKVHPPTATASASAPAPLGGRPSPPGRRRAGAGHR